MSVARPPARRSYSTRFCGRRGERREVRDCFARACRATAADFAFVVLRSTQLTAQMSSSTATPCVGFPTIKFSGKSSILASRGCRKVRPSCFDVIILTEFDDLYHDGFKCRSVSFVREEVVDVFAFGGVYLDAVLRVEAVPEGETRPRRSEYSRSFHLFGCGRGWGF